MCRTSPRNSGGLRLPLELTAAFTADDFAGKRILILILPDIRFNIMLFSMLLQDKLYLVKHLSADDRLVMLLRIVAVNFTVIVVPSKAAVRIGFHERGSAVVFFVHKYSFDR